MNRSYRSPVYRALAWLIAAEVVVQAMAIAYGMAGLGHWVDDGGVLTKASVEGDSAPFPEVAGFAVHGINGTLVIPVLALMLLIWSFFARIPGGRRWAGAVFVLVLVQITLGGLLHSVPALGALHGLNALLLFAAAVHAARRMRATRPAAGTTTAAATSPSHQAARP